MCIYVQSVNEITFLALVPEKWIKLSSDLSVTPQLNFLFPGKQIVGLKVVPESKIILRLTNPRLVLKKTVLMSFLTSCY